MSFQTNYISDYHHTQNSYNPYAAFCNAHTLNLLQQMIYQNQLLKQKNIELVNKLKVLQEEKDRVKSQNNSLKIKNTSMTAAAKRKYSKRRTWLEKKYICPSSDCGNKYSSTIALNLHIRKHHLVQDSLE